MARNNKETSDDTAKLAKRRYDLSSDYCRPYFERFIDNYKHYFIRIIDEAVESDNDNYPFYSQLMLPISYQIVETILPRMVAKVPNFSIQTEEENDTNDEVALRELIRYQLQHPYLVDDPIFARLATAGKELFITGNAWGAVPWWFKEIEVEEWQPYSPDMGLDKPSWDNMDPIKEMGIKPKWKLVKIKKKVIDAPVFQHKSVFHVFPDPKKKRVSDLGYAIIEENMTKDEIMEMVEMNKEDYKNIDKFLEMEKKKEQGSTPKIDYDNELASIFGSSNYSHKDTDEPTFKVWFQQEPNKLSVVINEKLTIRESKNPNGDGKIGLFLMKDIPIPHELYAWGEPDPIKRIEDSMTDQANMRNDSVMYDLLRMWKLDPTALLDGEDFVPEPGTVIQMKNGQMDGLMPLETGNTKPSAYREYQEWESVIQNVTGVSDYATGGSDPGMNKTLGGVELLQQAANARFAFKLQLFEQLGLKAMGTMYVQRNLRFFDTPQSVNGPKGKILVEPETIRRIKGNIHFIVDSGSTEAINKNTELAKWAKVIEWIQIGKPPFDNLSQEAMDYVGKHALMALGETQPDEILRRNPAQPAQNQPAAPGQMPPDLAAAMGQMQGPPQVGPQVPQEGIDNGQNTPTVPDAVGVTPSV